MKTIKLLILSMILLMSGTAFSQNSDKATVYIVRTSSLGAAMNIKYFVDDQYVGKFKYGKYFKLELEAGQHVIWAKAENRDYIHANLEAGKTYVINTLPQMGAFKAAVRLIAVNNPTEKEMNKINKYVIKKKLVVYEEEKRILEQKDYADIIAKGLAKYKEIVKGSQDLEKLTNPLEINFL